MESILTHKEHAHLIDRIKEGMTLQLDYSDNTKGSVKVIKIEPVKEGIKLTLEKQ